MNAGRKLKLALTVLTIATIGFWIISADTAEKTKTPAKQKAPERQFFNSCHPRGADLSPDGKLFATANQDYPILSVLEIGPEQKQTPIQLPKKAYDVVFIDSTRSVVSFGPWGELAIVDLKQGLVDRPFKVGATAEGMCRVSSGQVVVVDSKKNSIHLVDPSSRAVLKSFSVSSKPAQMRWLVPDLQIEVADAQGKILGTIELPQQSPAQEQK